MDSFTICSLLEGFLSFEKCARGRLLEVRGMVDRLTKSKDVPNMQTA